MEKLNISCVVECSSISMEAKANILNSFHDELLFATNWCPLKEIKFSMTLVTSSSPQVNQISTSLTVGCNRISGCFFEANYQRLDLESKAKSRSSFEMLSNSSPTSRLPIG